MEDLIMDNILAIQEWVIASLIINSDNKWVAISQVTNSLLKAVNLAHKVCLVHKEEWTQQWDLDFHLIKWCQMVQCINSHIWVHNNKDSIIHIHQSELNFRMECNKQGSWNKHKECKINSINNLWTNQQYAK